MNSYNKKRNAFCSKCGNSGHEYNNCREPITSWGIILVNLGNLRSPFNKYNYKEFDLKNDITMEKNMIENKTDIINIFSNLSILLVSRKHSLGFIEFIRGRYEISKKEYLMYLFKQMKSDEIEYIKKSKKMVDGFEYLWEFLWGEDHKSKSDALKKDKNESKKKYEKLINNCENMIDLDFLINVDLLYDNDEWGFPKGRIKKNEDKLDCAIREFKEETAYTDDDFRIIENIAPIVENLTGTNGKRYRHVYYVAELISGKKPVNNKTKSQRQEIGDIRFMLHENSLVSIREYHHQRKVIIIKLFNLYLNQILKIKTKKIKNDNNIVTNILKK
jgi:ADP-ribose pyrophosphatase YjhB (NUDIX family)